MCQIPYSNCELEAVESPQSFDEGPEAFLKVNIAGECGRELIIFVLLRRQVLEKVED